MRSSAVASVAGCVWRGVTQVTAFMTLQSICHRRGPARNQWLACCDLKLVGDWRAERGRCAGHMSVAKPHNITGSRIDPKLLFLHHLEPTSFLKSLNKLRNDTCNAGPVFRELPVDATDLCAMASQDALNTATSP